MSFVLLVRIFFCEHPLAVFMLAFFHQPDGAEAKSLLYNHVIATCGNARIRDDVCRRELMTGGNRVL